MGRSFYSVFVYCGGQHILFLLNLIHILQRFLNISHFINRIISRALARFQGTQNGWLGQIVTQGLTTNTLISARKNALRPGKRATLVLLPIFLKVRQTTPSLVEILAQKLRLGTLLSLLTRALHDPARIIPSILLTI